MPAEVTHIIFADHFLKKYHHFERKDFMLGTLFPDVRYLGVVSREATHPPVTKVAEVLNEKDGFNAGWKFHIYLDFILNDQYFQSFQRDDNNVRAAKFYQDMIVYDEVPDWTSIISYLHPEKTFPLGVPQKVANKWYSLLREYFKKKPTIETMRKFFGATAFPEEAQEDVLSRIEKFQSDKKIDHILREMTEKVHEAEIF